MFGGEVVQFSQSADGIVISLPPQAWQSPDTIVVLDFDASVAGAQVKVFPSGSLARGKPVRASNVYQGLAAWGPSKAVDDDPDTRWATDAGVHSAWLEVDLEQPFTIGRAIISEAFDRVRRFELQRLEGEQWVTFFAASRIGQMAEFTFPPVTTSRVRLNILEATDGPTIWEFQLFPPQGK
ncbi:MAG: discoidin domain-containing protein [Armatimonadetes bacterium]|nr:discoidin domain-containing protein [Armatimonadota bacterium]